MSILEEFDTVDAVDLPVGPFPGQDDAVAAATVKVPRMSVEMLDGTVYDAVQVALPDLIQWEDTAAKHRWPEISKAPNRWGSFVTWHALRRTGRIGQGVGYDAFKDQVLIIREATADPVPPTRPGPGPG